MADMSDQKRKDAFRALINIALLEGAVLMLVVGVYLYTNNIVHLVGGIIGSTLIFAPMFWRWYTEHGSALQSRPNSGGGRDG